MGPCGTGEGLHLTVPCGWDVAWQGHYLPRNGPWSAKKPLRPPRPWVGVASGKECKVCSEPDSGERQTLGICAEAQVSHKGSWAVSAMILLQVHRHYLGSDPITDPRL